ncbi:unnamed protein product, partial [marine sediment metagenome]
MVLKCELKFGKGKVAFEINEKNYMGELLPNEVEFDLTGEAEVQRALENPIGTKPLKEIAKKGEKIVIVTSDITRPMPSKIVLP